MTGARAVFLDKDGTVIANVPYNVHPGRIRLLPGVGEGLRALHGAGYRIVIVTNQSGVARGFFTEEELRAAGEHIGRLLAAEGVPLAGFYYCPHLSDGVVPAYSVRCDCRKPSPGLLLRAARELDLDLAASWMVGDILHDVEAGRRAGCRTVLVAPGGETEWALSADRLPHHIVGSVAEASRVILALDGGRPRAGTVLRRASTGRR